MNALSRMLSGSLSALLAAVALLSGAAFAQVPDRVGRIAYLAGDVQFYSESAQAWLPAQLNAPVSSRNSLFTGAGSRAEIRFGSTAVALDGQTQLDIQVLDDTSFRAAVPRGSVSLRVPQVEADESFAVTAPGASYAVLQAGRFRIDATDSGSRVTVLAGLVDASVAGGSSVMVEAGQALAAANGGFERAAARSSALDSWAAQRDNANRSSQSARYVSQNMTGYEELDANGRWASDPDYGNVWYPTSHVSSDWVPYRDGNWAYVAPWGWTWIDAAPWGFAPIHYGRWVLIGPRWAWMPGTYVRRPSYAPALVGFIGGSGAGSAAISISIGTRPAVGWYPLPPWERYQPGYGHRDSHLRNINNFNISKPPSSAWRMVENRRVSANQVQGATVVPREAFVDSRQVRRAAIAVAAPVLAAPARATAPVAAPVQHAVSASSAGTRPEFGDRRGSHEPDQGRTERARGVAGPGNGPVPQTRTAEPSQVLQQAAPATAVSGPRIFRSETRAADREAAPAVVVPAARESVPASRAVSAQPVQVVPDQPVVRESRSGNFRGENRNERQSAQPVIVAPQPSQPVSAPQARPPVPQPEAAVPRMRSETPPVRVEPRIEQRVEPRIEPRAVQRIEPRVEPRVELRVEPRIEPRPEPRQMQRVEPPPQVRAAPPPQPQPQPEQKRAPEQERERRPHGDRDKEK